jgi:multiple sugar transport system substrate-binding protein
MVENLFRTCKGDTEMKRGSMSRRGFLKSAGCVGLGLTLAACVPAQPAVQAPGAEPAAPPAAKTKIVLWGWWEERMKIFEQAANDFAEQSGDVEIVVEVFGSDLWPKVLASVPAGTGPALCKMQTTNYFRLRDEGLLVELDEDAFPDSFLQEKYPNHAWDSYGRYCMAEGGQPAIFVYNKRMFTEAGLDPESPPRTWSEFFTAAEQLTVRDANGVITREGFAPDDWLPVLNPLFQLGGVIVKGEGDTLEANFDNAEMEQAYQFFVDAARTHEVWDPSFPYFTEAVGNQLAATSIGEAWAHGVYKNDFPDTFEELGFSAPPTPTGEADPYYGRQNAVLGLAVIKNRPDAETEAAHRFMEYFYHERLDSQFELDKIAGLVPARVELLEGPEVAEDPFLSLGAQLLPKEYDAVEVTGSLNQVVTDALNLILLENRTVADALTFGQTELQKLIDSGEIKYLR